MKIKLGCALIAVSVGLMAPAQAFLPRGSVTNGSSAPAVTNPTHIVPQEAYVCSTNYYVNHSTGSDSNNGTSQTFTSGTTGPWLTISHAEATLATGTHPATCINVAGNTPAAPLVYAEDVNVSMVGSANTTSGFAVTRCAANAATPTAQPELFWVTGGAQGSMPSCQITGSGGNRDAGIVAFGDGVHHFDYAVFDGFDLTSSQTTPVSVSALSYVSGTGQVTLMTGTSPALTYRMCFTVSGLVGTGSIAAANGYQCADQGTSGTTIKYTIAPGLTLARTSGGTLTYPSGTQAGIGDGPSQINPGAHHMIAVNNYVHDIGGGGFQAAYSDFVIWADNVVRNTSWQNANDESGMSMVVNVNATFTAAALDTYFGTDFSGTSMRNCLCNNSVSNNGNLNAGAFDGDGIIFDTLIGSNSGACTGGIYSFGTLVYGNESYYNGGKGIHSFFSNHVSLFNNTTYDNNNSLLTGTAFNLDIQCSSFNEMANNVSYNTTGSGTLATNVAGASVNANSSAGTNNWWTNNFFFVSGTLTNCATNFGSSGDGNVCYNTLDTIFKASNAPAAYAGGTTYAAQTAVTQSGNVFMSLIGSNVGHSPIAEAPTPGSNGAHWQNEGPPNNQYAVDPLFAAPGPTLQPDLRLQGTSPALAASTQAVTGLGGPTVSTPNAGFW